MNARIPCTPVASLQHAGFVLVAVSLLLALIAASALVLNREGAQAVTRNALARHAAEARLVAGAGLAHARWQANASACNAYALPDTAFDDHSYTATFSPAAGSPVEIAVTATHASGITRSVVASDVPVFEAPATLVLQGDPGAGEDTWLYEWKPGWNYGADTDLYVSNRYAFSLAHALLSFDLGGLPAAAEVIGATLELYQNSPASLGGTVGVRRVTAAWAEGSANGGNGTPNWTERSAGVNWGSAGGDMAATSEGSVTIASGTVGWFALDITGLVRDWAAGTVANQGLALVPESVATDVFFHSSEHGTSALRPRLTITYACECGGGAATVTTLQPGIAGEDTFLDDNKNLENFGAEPLVRLTNKAGNQKRALLRFDLSSIPVDAIVSSATLQLNLEGIGSANSGTAEVYRVTEDWLEGSGGGVTCWNGASWLERDGACGTWATPGGSFAVTPEASAPIDWLSPGAVTWDLTSLVSTWVDGSYPNQGMMLIPSSGINHANFTTGDAPDASLHPKLTVEWFCTCDAECTPPVVLGTDLLMVVVDPGSLSAQDLAKRALFEAWGFTVTAIDEAAPQADFDTAFGLNDVVYVTQEVTSATVGTKLTETSIGVVTEEDNLSDELGMADSINWGGSQQALTVTDNTHYVTQPFALGLLPILSSSEALADVTGALAPDLRLLASSIDGPALVAIEKGGTLTGGGFAAGRRVQLPWGSNTFDVNTLTDDGRTLLRRAVEWGATDSGIIIAAYVDQFESGDCDPGVAYTQSDGSLDWSTQAWSEIGDDGDPCGGQVRSRLDGGDRSLRLQSSGTGLQRGVDLTGATFATLALNYRRVDFDDVADYLAVEVSADGSAWSELARLQGPADDTDYLDASWDITAWAGAGTALRLLSVGLGGSGAGQDLVYVDNVVFDTDATGGGGGPTCTATLADDFQSAGYGGSTGTLAWAGPWQEHNEADGAANGDELIVSVGGDLAVRVQDNDGGGEGVWREADLSGGYTTATLTFDYWQDGLDTPTDHVRVELSSDGGANWTEIARVEGPADDTAWRSASYDVAAWLGAQFALRFVTSADMGNSDAVYFDDVQVCLD